MGTSLNYRGRKSIADFGPIPEDEPRDKRRFPLFPLMVTIVVLAVGLFFISSRALPTVDVLVIHSRIWTGVTDKDNAIIWAEAMAVQDGRIVAVGKSKDLSNRYHARRTIDGYSDGHRMITPGFSDSHVHMLLGGYGLTSVQLRDASTKEEFIRRVADYARDIAKPGEWMMDGSWNHELWGGELPTRHWIDAVTPNNPAFLCRLDGHMCLANSLALRLANLTKDTPDVTGGVIEREADGEPAGVLKDKAMAYIMPLVGAEGGIIPEKSDQQKDASLRAAMSYMSSNGITSVHHMGSWEDLHVFERFNHSGELSVRIHAAVPMETWSRLADRVKAGGRGNRWLSLGSLKAFTDGSFGSQTALMFDPYLDSAGNSSQNRGISVDGEDMLRSCMLSADAEHLQSSVHAIGDRANDILLTIREEMDVKNGPRDRRFRIEHAQALRTSDVPRFARNQIIASMQPYHLMDDGVWLDRLIGPSRAKRQFPFREMIDMGITLAFGSDWFVAPATPIEGIYGAVTRRTLDGSHPDGWTPSQKITVDEALMAYTYNPNYAIYQEHSRGRIVEGQMADFVLLSEDLTAIPTADIHTAKVLETFVEGRSVFKRS
ncbi:hypothetical protein PROFUN_12217 [Planoprotostelium fungivorum]|uniref:Amidohydrolase 3 domain-containing protein n=1 Tax=Planoprotostelium fungivorum TaxID=1890364 RepID=A0A2P6N862_9EUKA|nr:hypothetical protein PROFUN_12217 [Planoprotostelium fungivorum]